MPVGTIAAFWAVSLAFVVTPGADWAYAIAAGLRHRTVLPAVGGLLIGHLAATAVVAAGVAALVARSPLVMTVLTVAGAAYLVWLGIGMLARPSAPQAGAEGASGVEQAGGERAVGERAGGERAGGERAVGERAGGERAAGVERVAGSWVRQVMKGAGISGLNPKVFLLFLALLPQFADRDAPWPVAAQIVVLGLVHVASCAVVYTGVGAGARLVLRARPAAARAVTRFSGAAMVGIGVLLLVEQLAG
ncbi:LysE family translocator [Nonomuraea sp. CA-143628]|uniref:LysE family translocator n=1 Tax=Nonomuraea sp. CA-143628 TaxID=3239997 RepID=UPI003D8CECD2